MSIIGIYQLPAAALGPLLHFSPLTKFLTLPLIKTPNFYEQSGKSSKHLILPNSSSHSLQNTKDLAALIVPQIGQSNLDLRFGKCLKGFNIVPVVTCQ